MAIVASEAHAMLNPKTLAKDQRARRSVFLKAKLLIRNNKNIKEKVSTDVMNYWS